MPKIEKLEKEGIVKPTHVRIVLSLHADNLVNRGIGILAHFWEDKSILSPIVSFPVVCEFLEMLLYDLLGMPSD